MLENVPKFRYLIHFVYFLLLNLSNNFFTITKKLKCIILLIAVMFKITLLTKKIDISRQTYHKKVFFGIDVNKINYFSNDDGK